MIQLHEFSGVLYYYPHLTTALNHKTLHTIYQCSRLLMLKEIKRG